jgi:hypothetical protein
MTAYGGRKAVIEPGHAQALRGGGDRERASVESHAVEGRCLQAVGGEPLMPLDLLHVLPARGEVSMQEDKIRAALVELLYRTSYGVVVANVLISWRQRMS